MKATIIAVGSELLGTDRLDTNSLKITQSLERFGVALVRKSVVADDRAALRDELLQSLEISDIVVISGGLGPTEDDITKEAVAEALTLPLDVDHEIVAKIERRFAKRGLEMAKTNLRQAQVFRDHQTISNPRGTAPGFHLTIRPGSEAKHVWIFPGVPHELEGMLESDLDVWLATVQRESRFRRILRVTGLPESQLDQMLRPFYENHAGEPVGIYAGSGELQIHLIANGEPDEAIAALDDRERELRQILGERIYGAGNDDLETVLGRLLTGRSETVATAESCTGGLLSSRLTDVSGSSAYFLGGVVAYTREAKLFLLGVDPAVIDEGGEVSEDVARQMARGARRRFGATYGIGITGIAGPTGGSEAKPVGTVHIAVDGPGSVLHRLNIFPGERELVKFFATQTALDMLRTMILSAG